MSVNGSLSGITFGGLTSGIDTDGIISRLADIERIPIRRLQVQQAQLRVRGDLYSGFKSRISEIAQAGNALTQLGAFDSVKSDSTKPEVATIKSNVGSQAGTYNLKVTNLASAQKISSAPQTSTTAAVGTAGTFSVNGKTVAVDATDSISSIAAKVNALGADVTASVLDGGAGNAYLTFTSKTSGIAGKPQISDLQGSVLSGLGVLNATTSIRQPIANGATSTIFSKSDVAVGTLLGSTGLTPQTVQINGTNVTLDLQNDSLQATADKINLAGTGAQASVITTVKDGVNSFRLEIKGAATPSFTDAGGALQSLGILQSGAGNELIAAQDAAYSIDGVNLSSSSNTIENVIPGSTLTLLKANATTPETTTLNLTSDTDTVLGKVKNLATKFNATATFIKDNSNFNAETFQTGGLFGDSVVRQYETSISSALFSPVSGLTGKYNNLSSIGFSLDREGQMQMNEETFKTAFATDPEGVRKIFQSFGTSANTNLNYVSSTTASAPSNGTPYPVEITQIATKTTYAALTAKTGVNASSEKLTFGGALFGSTGVDLMVDVGMNMGDIVSKINNDPRLRDLITASDNAGTLKVESKRFGTNGIFSLVSNQSAAGNNSGVGFAGTLVSGVNVAGNIAGQAATGNGQFLTGASTNATANGLQVQYTGTALGIIGDMTFNRGLSTGLNEVMNTFTDLTNGLTVTSEKSVRDQADGIQKDIDAINARATSKTTELRARFAAMEERMANIRAQGSRLAGLFPQSQGQ
jgi:flagellar hook-associated protein 2